MVRYAPSICPPVTLMSMLILFSLLLLGALALMTLVWAVSVPLRDASLVDRFWGLGFLLLTGFAWGWADFPVTGWIIIVPVGLWALRLSAFITWRNWGRGEDPRYTTMRGGLSERRFVLRSLVMIFWLQGGLMALIALPLVAAATGRDPWWPLVIVGLLVWLAGFLYETIADWQLARFKRSALPGQVYAEGLWAYSRHPNYFGEIIVWVGYALLALSFAAWWALPSAILMIILILRVSGVTLLEQRMEQTHSGYAEYQSRTPALIPRWHRNSA